MDTTQAISNSECPRPRILELLLQLTSAKYDKLEKALEMTWIAHVVVAALGLAMVVNLGKVPESVVGYFLQGKYDLKTVAAIILAVHLYYFMRTGHLLTAFNDAKAFQDGLLDDYLTGHPEKGKVAPLHRTMSFLAAAFYPHAEAAPYFIITALVVSLAQASSLFLVVKAYHAGAMSSLGIVLFFMIILYYLFWKAQRDRTRATRAVIVLSVLTVSWFSIFYFSTGITA
jgi:hypothetical protein